MIRDYLQFPEERSYTFFFDRKEAFRAKKCFLDDKGVILVGNGEKKRFFDGEK